MRRCAQILAICAIAALDSPVPPLSRTYEFERPILSLQSHDAYPVEFIDATWEELRSHLHGWNATLRITGATHETFSDLPLLTGAGAKAFIEIQQAMLRNFFQQHVVRGARNR